MGIDCGNWQSSIGISRPYGPNTRDSWLLFGVMLSVGLLLGVGTGSFLKPHGNRFFVEGDPALSYPFVEDIDVQMPIWLLLSLTLALPFPIFAVFHLAIFGKCSIGKRIHPRLIITILYFLLSFLVAIFITQAIKHYEGRLRPDFYAMCNYKNYRTAIKSCDSGTGTWWACAESHGYIIEKGAPGNFDDCLDQNELGQARSSYPSGHASLPAANLGFLAIFFYFSFTGPELWSDILKLLLPATCIWGAIMIAASRPKDYWHNFSDINAGMAIGFSAALCCGYRWSVAMVLDPLTQNQDDPPNRGDSGDVQTLDMVASISVVQSTPQSLQAPKASELNLIP